MVESKTLQKSKLIFLLALLLRLLLALFSGYHPDLGNHLDWGEKLLTYGTKNFYEHTIWAVSWPNQPIGTIYIFGICALVTHNFLSLIDKLNILLPLFPSFIVPFLHTQFPVFMVKLPFILSDLGIGVVIYLLLHKKYLYQIAILWLFNPLVIYNSTIWGQTDSLINFIFLSGLYLLTTKKSFIGLTIILLGFLIKLSLLIFLPLLLVYLLLTKFSIYKIILGFLSAFLLYLFVSMPFADSRGPILWLKYMFIGKVLSRQGDMLSGNAFNLWTLLYGVNFGLTSAKQVFLFSAKTLGTFLFGLCYLVILLKLITKPLQNNLYLALGLVSFSAYLFLTNMHERYLYPFFPLYLIYILKSKSRVYPYILLSILHLANLYNLWFYPRLTPLVNILQFEPSTKLFSAILIAIFVTLLLQYPKGDKHKKGSI